MGPHGSSDSGGGSTLQSDLYKALPSGVCLLYAKRSLKTMPTVCTLGRAVTIGQIGILHARCSQYIAVLQYTDIIKPVTGRASIRSARS